MSKSRANPDPVVYPDATRVPAPEPLPVDEHTGKGGSYVIGSDGRRRPVEPAPETESAAAKK